MKLLLVDDDKVIHLSFTKPLAEAGFEVLNAYDGQQALEMAIEHKPEIILLDLNLPKIDGRDVCKQLKSNPETKDMKILMLTAKDEQHNRVLGFELGADEYITKPCSAAYIERAIKKALKL